MLENIKSTFANVVRPLVQRPKELQVAAVCTRKCKDKLEVLLITSRGSGRWVVPKGWIMEGKTAREAAIQEAWEEAGVQGKCPSPEPIGQFVYTKRLDEGYDAPVDVQVFRIKVDRLARKYPEQGERRRQWFSPKKAAKRVNEPQLKEILLNL